MSQYSAPTAEFADNTALFLGTGQDSSLSYDGIDTFWDLRAVGAGGLLIALAAGFPSPDRNKIHIWDGTAGAILSQDAASILVIESDGAAYINFLTPNNVLQGLRFGDPQNADAGLFAYDHTLTCFRTFTEGVERLRFVANRFIFQENIAIESTGTIDLQGTGIVTVNDDGLDVDFRVEGLNDANLLVIDAGQDNIGIGGVPNANRQLDLQGVFNGNTRFSVTDILQSSGEAQQVFIGGTINSVANVDAHGVRIAPTLVEAGSGTHNNFDSLAVVPPVITVGAASLTNATTLKITGAPTGALNNFALWVIGASKFAGDIIPEADGTRDLGIQTTAQWANVWSDLINGSDYSYLNRWRTLEADKYEGYPIGWAIGTEGFKDGIVSEKMAPGLKPLFAVTEDFIEFKGTRLSGEFVSTLEERLVAVEEANRILREQLETVGVLSRA